MTELAFGDGILRVVLGPSARSDAVVLTQTDDLALEDAYKAALRDFARAGRSVALFAPLSAAGARVATYVVGAELARGGVVREAVFILPDPRTCSIYAHAAADLLRR